MKKNFLIIFVVFTLIPLAALFFSPFFKDKEGVILYTDYEKAFLALLWVPIISSLYILFRNYTDKVHSIVWYIIAMVFGVGSFLLWFAFESLSHFGF